MLINLLDWFKFDVGEGAFYALFGFLFVFCGIALLVTIFVILGLIMKRINARRPKEKTAKQRKGKKKKEEPAAVTATEQDGVSAVTVAIISAAIAAYYEEQNEPCDFVVRRIKKL